MQLNLFEFEEKFSYKYNDYILLDQNKYTYNLLINDNLWKNFILYGGFGSGKTHLCNIWQKLFNAVFIRNIGEIINIIDLNNAFILEGIEKITNEVEFLHLFNYINEKNKRLLMTSAVSPKLLGFKLDDLKSRIVSTMSAKLVEPNEELLKIALIKQFTERQWHIDLKIIDYILKHYGDSFEKINRIVRLIDRESIHNSVNVSISLIRLLITKIKEFDVN